MPEAEHPAHGVSFADAARKHSSAAYRFPGGLDPLLARVLVATVTVWATFAPCCLFVLLGAPFVERLRGNRRLGSTLAGVTSAVVGVIAGVAIHRFRVNVVWVVVTGALGWASSLVR